MLRFITVLMVILASTGLTACGPARPDFAAKNSLKVSVLVEGGGSSQLVLHAGYVATSPSCHHTPKAFGIIPQRAPVHSTAYIHLPVKLVRANEFSALVPVPTPDSCKWSIEKIVPELMINDLSTIFTPSPSVTGNTYLPEGILTYYCRVESGRYTGPFNNCNTTKIPNSSMTLTISIKK